MNKLNTVHYQNNFASALCSLCSSVRPLSIILVANYVQYICSSVRPLSIILVVNYVQYVHPSVCTLSVSETFLNMASILKRYSSMEKVLYTVNISVT